MSTAGNDFTTRMLRNCNEHQPFRPFAVYNREGDCIEFYLSNEPSYAQRLDGLVTVFFAEASGEVVGGLVKGVHTSLLERFPGFRIFIESRTARISVLLSGPASQAQDHLQRTYKNLIEKVHEQDISADLQPA